MYVRVTLYKTGFDLSNIFVGAGSADRLSALHAFPDSKKLILPAGAFNPQYPFRIRGNFLKYSRVYDYAEFEFANDESITQDVQRRFYFVKDFTYINDDLTEINALEDIVGNIWWSVQYSRFFPERYTYRKSEGGTCGLRKSSADFSPSIFNYEPIFDGRVSFSKNGDTRYLGAIANVATYSSINIYIEKGVNYPFEIDLIFFEYDEIGNVYDISGGYIEGDSQKKTVATLNEFNAYCSQITEGFQIIQNYILLDLFDIVESVTYSSGETKIKSKEYFSGIGGLWPYRQIGPRYVCVIQKHEKDVAIPITIPNDPHFRSPYNTILSICNGKQIEIDPIYFEANTNVNLSFFRSFIPPGNSTLFQTDSYAEAYPEKSANFIPIRKWDLGQMAPFGVFKDSYAEWVRTNYNSTILGLETQQKFDKERYKNDQAYAWGRAALSSGTSIAKGFLAKNPAKGVAGGLIDTISTLGNQALNQAQAYDSLQFKLDEENALLSLKLEDIKSQPDTVNFQGGLGNALFNLSYFHIMLQTADNINYVKKYNDAFGYSFPKTVGWETSQYISATTIKNHTRYDYIKATDVCFSPMSSIKLTQTELIQFKKQLSEGFRVWYSITSYKDFSENDEVQESSGAGGDISA